MKSAALFALRLVVLTVVLIIIFMIAMKVSMTGMPASPQLSAPTPQSQAQQAAATLPPLLAYTFLISLVTAWILQNARWRGLKLIAALVFSFYGLMTFLSQMESLVYLGGKLPPGLVPRLFLMGAVIALLFVPVAVLIMGKMRGAEDAVLQPLSSKSKLLRFGVLAVVYVVLYYLFGYYVAWQNPDVRLYYSGSTAMNPLISQMKGIAAQTPWMLPFQYCRGLLWALFAYPVVRMLKNTRLEIACTLAAWFGIWSFVLLMPNPLMPAAVAHTHFWETLWCDLLLGAIMGWVLAAKAATIAKAATSGGA